MFWNIFSQMVAEQLFSRSNYVSWLLFHHIWPFTTHLANGPWNNSLNFILLTKYVIPKSLSSLAISQVRQLPFLDAEEIPCFGKTRGVGKPGHRTTRQKVADEVMLVKVGGEVSLRDR